MDALTASFGQLRSAMVNTTHALQDLATELDHGYRQYVAARAAIRSRHPRPARLRRDDEPRPIGRVLSVEERRGLGRP